MITMTTEILKNEILSEAQLESVAGGTNKELNSLVDAIRRNSDLEDALNFKINIELNRHVPNGIIMMVAPILLLFVRIIGKGSLVK